MTIRHKINHHKQGKNNNYMGKVFESYVVGIYSDLGKLSIKKNVILKKEIKYNNSKKCIKSEFDIVYGIIFKNYIECKYKSSRTSKVSAQEVSLFIEKLRFHKINTSRGIFITNKYFSLKAIGICRVNNIKIIDHDKLDKLDYKRMNILESMKYLLSKSNLFKNNLKYSNLEYRILNHKA